MTERIVILGAGQAGAQAVASLRAEGYAGAITLAGEEPFAPYQRPPLSKAYLAGDMVAERLMLKPENFYAEAACELRLKTKAISIDRVAKTVHFAGGAALGYDKLLLTTGARVRHLSVPGAELSGLYYLRGIADVDALHPHFQRGARLVIVGGGYIGLEVAAVAVKRGLEVTVIEAASRVMERAVSPHLSDFYEKEHRGLGVRIMLGAKAQTLDGKEKVEAVTTNAGHVPTDFVVAGIGIVPNSEIAEQAGLACDDGIVVDEFTRTSAPDIYAAGDCTNHPSRAGPRVRLESVQNAIDQAKHAALAMLDRPNPYREVPWFWSDQYDLKLQIAGLMHPEDVAVLRGNPAGRKFAVFHLRDGAVAAVEAVNATQEYIIGRRLIADGREIDARRLADIEVPIKSFL